MNTSEICKKLKMTPKMLRIYEESGLIKAKRDDNGYRNYSIDEALQIRVIAILRRLNFSIKEIKYILENCNTKTEAQYKFYIQLKAMESRIAELNSAKAELKDTINRIIDKADSGDIKNMLIQRSDERCNQEINFIKEWNFDEMAVGYIERFLEGDEGYQRAIVRTRELMKRLGKGKKIIDVGCGTCNLWEPFDNMDLVALDKSLPMLMVSRDKVPWAKFLLEDILDISLEKIGKFDVVVSTFAFHHIAKHSQEAALKNVVSLCEDNGVIVIVDKSFDNHDQRLLEEKNLMTCNKMGELEMLRSEYYLYTTETKQYLEYMGYDTMCERLERNIVIYTITKKKSNQ